MRVSQPLGQTYATVASSLSIIHTDGAADLDVLIDLIRRSPLLEELRGDAFARAELQDRLNVSRSTSHRHTKLFGEMDVIEKANGEFRLTESGKLLTDAMVRFKREADSALQLAPVLEAIQDAPVEINSEAFAGATVTNTERGDPYSPMARFVALVRETETLHGFDMDAIAPLYLNEIRQRIIDGMETKDIGLPEATKNALDDYPEKCTQACASGYLEIRLHDDLPFGLAIFDDRVGIGARERDTRALRVFVDTGSPEVREWAETVFEVYDAEAVPLEEFTQEGYRDAMEMREGTA